MNDIFELENTKRYIKFLEDENKELKERINKDIENEVTFIMNKKGYGKENWELQRRIIKAIKYIEEVDCILLNRQEQEELLDILKGSDKE